MTIAITFLILAPVAALVMGLVWISEHTTILDRIADMPGMAWLHYWIDEPAQ